MLEYRPCVLAVFTNSHGQVLVCERSDHNGHWQFPQGGIDPGESPEQAVLREIWEELGCKEVRIIAQAPEKVFYDFPKEIHSEIAKKWRGQSQVWFLLEFKDGFGPNLDAATDKEFIATCWVAPHQALERIVTFKKSAYERGLTALNILF